MAYTAENWPITAALLHNPPVVFFDEPCHRLEAKPLRSFNFERSGVDERAIEAELTREVMGDHPGRPPDVEHRPAA